MTTQLDRYSKTALQGIDYKSLLFRSMDRIHMLCVAGQDEKASFVNEMNRRLLLGIDLLEGLVSYYADEEYTKTSKRDDDEPDYKFLIKKFGAICKLLGRKGLALPEYATGTQ